jgi:hypothetical protein
MLLLLRQLPSGERSDWKALLAHGSETLCPSMLVVKVLRAAARFMLSLLRV